MSGISEVDITADLPEDDENKIPFTFTIVFLVLGFFIPPCWLLTLIFRNHRNRKVQILRFVALFLFWLEFLLLFIAAWVALVYFMEWWPQWVDTPNPMYNEHFKIGEIFAVVFGVLFLSIVLYETLCGVTDFTFEKLNKKKSTPEKEEKADAAGTSKTT